VPLRAILAALLLAPAAAAQEPPLAERLAACAREAEEGPRLACFDALARAAAETPEMAEPAPPEPVAEAPPPPVIPPAPQPAEAAAPPAPEPPVAAAPPPPRGLAVRDAGGRVIGAGDWLVLHDVDSLLDRPRVTLTLDGELEFGETRSVPFLSLRCDDRRLEAFVTMRSYLNSEGGIPVRFRFDGGAVVAQTWSPSTNGEAAFAPDPRGLAERIGQSRRLVLETTGFRGARSRAVFDLTGAEHVLPEIAACRQAPRRAPR
jgi:hypothetical protein